jgi:UDP-N-acetylglucosamine:LPS N-acetylglucosamine transferase
LEGQVPGKHRKRVLAVASGGGHWEQMMLLRPAWQDHEVHYATTLRGLGERAQLGNAHYVPDCNRNAKFKMIRSAAALMLLILRIRPHIIVTTGALPGLLALVIGKHLGARTIWIDSVANAEEMSLAGQRAQKHADLWLSQWPGVAQRSGARYAGSVL